MRSPSAARLLALTAALYACTAGVTGCTSLLGDFTSNGSVGTDGSVEGGGNADSGGDSTVTTDGGGEGGLAQGTTCSADSQCTSGHCVDGVCCESACDGVCETCNGSPKGMCTPIPEGMDPQMECVTAPLPEAGSPEAGDDGGDAGAVDGGDGGEGGAAPSDAGASDTGAAETGLPDAALVDFIVPDGGFKLNSTTCAGTCSGARACKFPDQTTICGTPGQFCTCPASDLSCSTPTQQAAFACDGTGRCGTEPARTECAGYYCSGSTCATGCTTPSDCQLGYFCNGSGACQKDKGNGVSCGQPNECESGFCVGSVCCSSDCAVPGGTCTASGHVGQCQCSVNCGDGGTCQLFYRDADGDGYGDKNGTLSNNNAKVGCAGSPPTGYVDDSTDCDDHDGNAHPGQSSYFGSPSLGIGTYDYNCDGTLQKSVPEELGGYCGYCTGTAPSCGEQSTCPASGDQAGFTCTARYLFFCNPITRICSSSSFCSTGTTGAFTSTVACGTTATYTTCGTCSAASGYPSNTYSSAQQQCH